MIFPGWGGLVDCLMSLDVCQWGIAQLSMALFNAKVEWTEHVLHVVLENGMKLTTESSEVTLKGVEDKVINKVFGSEIYHAIAECAMRRREMAEGRDVTECREAYALRTSSIHRMFQYPNDIPLSLFRMHSNKLPCLLFPVTVIFIDSDITSLPIYHLTPAHNHFDTVLIDIIKIYCRVERLCIESLMTG
ncbi:hypothetical protein COCMIDRAFT_107789 [Bipolaris oryzae ATCC 44560]|uniref:Uncharacterized protein n=1 Tax=Bipolaris oryzae ATCC 44560 TaxID=930090 RepID=W6YT86_COCMI|nr:uncharacterized protein COCMIDRAFT_107789 [Bipolaris oryzae ATCC 44560]EUC40815.1 hypothetical protein COCMIDRAFT_107789 [Bipolaris oryzae ATCC 44560]